VVDGVAQVIRLLGSPLLHVVEVGVCVDWLAVCGDWPMLWARLIGGGVGRDDLAVPRVGAVVGDRDGVTGSRGGRATSGGTGIHPALRVALRLLLLDGLGDKSLNVVDL
jgi:hypothetical protein